MPAPTADAGRAVITLLRETDVTHAVILRLPFFREHENGYGGKIITGPCGFHAQKSGHGHWCEFRLWRFEWWGCGRSGKHIHALIRPLAAAKTGGAV